MAKNGNKATIREVRDLIDKLDDEKISPMKESLTEIKTMLTIHLTTCKEYREQNDEDKDGFISKKLFITISVILGFIVTGATLLQFFIR